MGCASGVEGWIVEKRVRRACALALAQAMMVEVISGGRKDI